MRFSTICVVGATGAVGEQIISLLEKRQFPFDHLRLFASPKSLGKSISFRNQSIPIETLKPDAFASCDLAFFAAGSAISKEWIPKLHCPVIDSSSAFRATAPLVIPEINPHALRDHASVISSPNCTATVLLMPLFRLHRLFRAKRIVASTYQAASGAGYRLLNELLSETRHFLDQKPYPHQLPFPYAFNLYPHNSPLHPSGYVEEELKILHETRKILEDDAIQVSATCIRVPVLRAHSVSANVEFHRSFTLDEVYSALADVPGLTLFEDRAANRFPTPLDATNQDNIYCGRFRLDPTQPNTLEFWSVGDQLLKGAALNAVQIAELFLVEKSKLG